MFWSNIPGELLHDIIDRLEVADVIRSEAVCTEWRSTICREYYSKSNIPLLMLSSPDDDKINYRYFYSLTDHKIYKFHLPEIAGQHCIGSSQGYLFSINENADIIATNPFAGGLHLPLPPTSTIPDVVSIVRDEFSGKITDYEIKKISFRDLSMSEKFDVKHVQDHHYMKAILSPDASTAVVVHGYNYCWPAFARVGDRSWTALQNPKLQEFNDMIFHKGRLHTVDYMGTLSIFDLDLPSDPPFVSPQGPLQSYGGGPMRYLVESPEGNELFLLFKAYDYTNDIPRTKYFKVYLLDETTYTWNEIKTLGEIAVFVGFNYSMSLCTRGCTGIKRNCIYFTDDCKFMYIHQPELAGDKGVFNLEDATVEYAFSDNVLDQLNWPPPTWFVPTLQ